VGFEKPMILSDRRRLLRPPLNCRASGFVQSGKSQPIGELVSPGIPRMAPELA
jgi:hypothetical protein